jgi:predicted  nucleic acid-binding Zn-ribbon protein
VHPDVSALLDVQTDDLHIYSIEDRLGALAPRLAALEKDRQKAEGALTETRAQIEAEEKRQRDIQDRLRQHRELRDKSETLLGQVTQPREAAAAMAQIEQAKRFIADEEREVEAINQRLADLRKLATDREHALHDIGQLQQETRATLEADRVALEKELSDARGVREDKARKVPRALMQRYDRIRQRRRSTALFALRGLSCAHCDTVIPVQRKNTMAGTGSTELCEGCGVLLYAAE